MAGLTVASAVVVVAGEDVLVVLSEAAAAVRATLDALDDWGPAGTRPGQYRSDLAADEAVLRVLSGAGFGALSEESGSHDAERDVVVVVDPVDGSTNAARGVPWFATSLCALDRHGPLAALVVNQATGSRFGAVRGEGAWRSSRDGDAGARPAKLGQRQARPAKLGQRQARPAKLGQRQALRPSGATELGSSLVLLSGYPSRYLGWKQFRALGAAALDLCAVAAGVADAYIDCSRDAHGSWDYLAGYLVCLEAGAAMVDGNGRELVVRSHGERRTPLAAATPELLEEVRQVLAVPAPKKG